MRSRVELTSCWRLFHPVRFEEDIGLGLLWRSLSKSAKPWLDNIPETLNISAHTDRQKTEMRWWCIIELRRWYIDYEKKEIWVSDLDSRDDWSWEGFWWMVQVSDTLPVTPTDTDCDAINNEWMNQARKEWNTTEHKYSIPVDDIWIRSNLRWSSSHRGREVRIIQPSSWHDDWLIAWCHPIEFTKGVCLPNCC